MVVFVTVESKNLKDALESFFQIFNKFTESKSWEEVKFNPDKFFFTPSTCFHYYVKQLLDSTELLKKQKNIIINYGDFKQVYDVVDQYEKKYLDLLCDSLGSVQLVVTDKKDYKDDFENGKIYFNYSSEFLIDLDKKIDKLAEKFKNDPLYNAINLMNAYGSYLGTSSFNKKIDKVFKIQEGNPGQRISFDQFIDLVEKNPDYDFLNNEYVIVKKQHPFEILYKTGLSKQ